MPALKRVSPALFSACGLDVALKIERTKAQKRLAARMPAASPSPMASKDSSPRQETAAGSPSSIWSASDAGTQISVRPSPDHFMDQTTIPQKAAPTVTFENEVKNTGRSFCGTRRRGEPLRADDTGDAAAPPKPIRRPAQVSLHQRGSCPPSWR
jgi:hypothetical protein